MPRKRKSLNEDVFVEDCASGMYTHQQLADRHGISLSLAKQIASGQRRPELRGEQRQPFLLEEHVPVVDYLRICFQVRQPVVPD